MMKETKLGTYIRGEESHAFTFETDLSTSKKLEFVNSVVSLVVDKEYYNSVIRDLMFDFYIVDIFTNIDTAELTDSNNFLNLDDVEAFLEETNVVDIVKANMVDGLLEQLNKAVDKSIEYKTGIHPSPLNEALASLINTLEKKVNEFDMNSAMEMVQKIAGITGDLNVNNIVDAYLNSDTHKKNLDEIAKAKASKNEINIDENLGEVIRTVVKENKVEK